MNKADRNVIRMLVRMREDFQGMRKRVDNRVGRKADGTEQNITEREFTPEDINSFSEIADVAHKQEAEIQKEMKKVLKRFPIYNEYLSKVKGVGEIAAAWIIADYDIHIATTVSKLWQFTGLNSGLVPGKKRVENKDGSFSHVHTGKMIRGDRLTPGHVAPFNKRLRAAMVGVLADGFIKACIRYRDATEDEFENTPESYRRRLKDGKKMQVVDTVDGYGKYYLDYKNRLANSDQITTEMKKGGKVEKMPWKDTTKGHRDRAARRYMIKMFLKDLYVAWREIEGLPVRAPYQEEYLGHKHAS